jgi:hypothetical protein
LSLLLSFQFQRKEAFYLCCCCFASHFLIELGKKNTITMKQLIVKNNIPEIKKICEKKGIDYEITQSNLAKKPKIFKKPKISQQELKEAYQKLAKSKNYEKEMKE